MKSEERSCELEKLAQENNWKFSATAEISSITALQYFEFQTGEKRTVERIENLIEGEDFKVFDVYWKTEFKVSDAFGPLAHKNTSAQNVHLQTSLLFEAKNLNLPKFHVYPQKSEGWLDKIFRKSNSSFSAEFEKHWIVQGDVKEIFDREIIEFYEKSESFWTFGTENYIFIYQPNILLAEEQVLDWIKRVSTLARLLKA